MDNIFSFISDSEKSESKEFASTLYLTYTTMVDVGFTSEQAMDLIKTMLIGVAAKKKE